MKYYKIMTFENKMIGAVSSANFVRYSTLGHSYLRCNEKKGEYVVYDGVTYRAAWMMPCKTDRAYIEAQVIEISESEYQIYMDAIEKDEELPAEEDDIPPLPEPTDEIEAESIAFVRTHKIAEMSAACRSAIEEGIDLNVHGEMHHFSLTTQDQLNLMSLNVMAQTQDIIPYHADGEVCVFFTAEEINQIVSAATAHKIYHTTYYNALKEYINALETIEAIAAITYGTPIPDEYQSEVLRVIENETAS